MKACAQYLNLNLRGHPVILQARYDECGVTRRMASDEPAVVDGRDVPILAGDADALAGSDVRALSAHCPVELKLLAPPDRERAGAADDDRRHRRERDRLFGLVRAFAGAEYVVGDVFRLELQLTGDSDVHPAELHTIRITCPAELPFAFAFRQPGGPARDEARLAGAGAVATTTGGAHECAQQSCEGQQQGSHLSPAPGRLAASLPRSWCV